jgi:alpha-N-arabinofuranosidase
MNTRQLKVRFYCFTAILTAGILTLHAATTVIAATPVNAVIDADKTFAPINPNIYGMFIEHAGSLVYRSMWAEMTDDRKFYNPITSQDTAPT